MDPLYLLLLPLVIGAWFGLGRISGRSDDGRDWCGPPPSEPGPSLLSRLLSRITRRP